MYNNVIDTKKQLESLRLLLLRDASIIDEGAKGGGGRDCKDNSSERCWKCCDKDVTIEDLRKRLLLLLGWQAYRGDQTHPKMK